MKKRLPKILIVVLMAVIFATVFCSCTKNNTQTFVDDKRQNVCTSLVGSYMNAANSTWDMDAKGDELLNVEFQDKFIIYKNFAKNFGEILYKSDIETDKISKLQTEIVKYGNLQNKDADSFLQFLDSSNFTNYDIANLIYLNLVSYFSDYNSIAKNIKSELENFREKFIVPEQFKNNPQYLLTCRRIFLDEEKAYELFSLMYDDFEIEKDLKVIKANKDLIVNSIVVIKNIFDSVGSQKISDILNGKEADYNINEIKVIVEAVGSELKKIPNFEKNDSTETFLNVLQKYITITQATNLLMHIDNNPIGDTSLKFVYAIGPVLKFSTAFKDVAVDILNIFTTENSIEALKDLYNAKNQADKVSDEDEKAKFFVEEKEAVLMANVLQKINNEKLKKAISNFSENLSGSQSSAMFETYALYNIVTMLYADINQEEPYKDLPDYEILKGMAIYIIGEPLLFKDLNRYQYLYVKYYDAFDENAKAGFEKLFECDEDIFSEYGLSKIEIDKEKYSKEWFEEYVLQFNKKFVELHKLQSAKLKQFAIDGVDAFNTGEKKEDFDKLAQMIDSSKFDAEVAKTLNEKYKLSAIFEKLLSYLSNIE